MHARWSRICRDYNFDWLPILFNRDCLRDGDVVSDFIFRSNLPFSYSGGSVRDNISLSPLVLCAFRRIAGASLDKLAWDRKTQLLRKLSALSADICLENGIVDCHQWKFKKPIEDYLSMVSSPEDSDFYVNYGSDVVPLSVSSIGGDHLDWNPLMINDVMPSGIRYADGYLTAPLELFLDDIHAEDIDRLSLGLQVAILRFFSSYYGEI